MNALPNLRILRKHIDITKVPFSDRGSRLLVFQMVGAPRLNVKLAERLTSINPNIEAYLSQPPFIDNLIHLLNPGESTGPYPIPSVARNDPHYNPEMMWRGPVWGNINYFFVEALAKVGREDLADPLAERTLVMIAGQPDIYEYDNPDTGQPSSTATDIVGWTAAVYIDLAIRQSQQHYSGEETRTAGPAGRTSAGV